MWNSFENKQNGMVTCGVTNQDVLLLPTWYSIFTLFLPKASQYGYFPVKDEDTEWWSPDWVHCLTEGDYDFEKAAKCLYKNHAPIFFKNENR